ncbi:alpha-L-rhamnosidase C-terminal domain-containing protein [Paenibacillus sp. HB172176]|uniref:alpha-L-rhamnosidase-related protein n=1 Tax=Paenibacillus sp. HB172176 TaxID=2493690 RepID=UPI00143AC7A7|nr:alpha-L-rhamnosidase C-terminal domain-containing protein [Paenibacillus sp. HB172176]
MEENKDWRAQWIWQSDYPWTSDPGAHEMVLFRRSFGVGDPAEAKLHVNVSADSRYRLYLNGESVSVGPCKGDSFSHYYESIDLSGKLRSGDNVLAAKVLHYAASNPHRIGRSGPISVHRSNTGAFLLEGAVQEPGRLEQRLDTDEHWRCRFEAGYSMQANPLIQWLGGCETVDGTRMSHGWTSLDYDDHSWKPAVVICATSNRFGELTPWQLTARPIPMLFEKDKGFTAVSRCEEGYSASSLSSLLDPDNNGTLTIVPRTKFWVELDAGELSTGYLRIDMRAGGGSEVRLLASECYEPLESQPDKRLKEVRDKAVDGKLVGDNDYYRVAGIGRKRQVEEVYEPFWFRTFRFVRLEIETNDEPLELVCIRFRDTGYPLDVQAEFQCSDTGANQLWALSVRTLRNCMHETYEDCPYYEQLQYTMDTRLQMLFTYGLSADDRLARRALHDYHSSALPSGMLQCRYPSEYPQVIPSFSLFWIDMLHDHYMHFGDLALLRRYRHTMAGLLNWFEQRLTPEKLVGPTPRAYWSYFDWVEQWPGGAPQAREHGPVTLLSQLYSAALQQAAELFEATGWRDAASEADTLAKQVNAALIRHCWHEERGMFADGPNIDEFSQHAQIWGVACGAVQGEAAKSLIDRMLGDASLAIVSLPMSYALFRVLAKIRMYERSILLWDRWRSLLKLNLTTLPEIAHGSPRSDCHAWSALPLSEYPGEILGVQPRAPGFAVIRIAPKMLNLRWARGKVATKHGLVSVDWHLDDGIFHLDGEGPHGIPIEIELPNGDSLHFPAGGEFQVVCDVSGCP